jgi:two-component system, chemotaxis family, protein-glutamate methylesterase/glutaminase
VTAPENNNPDRIVVIGTSLGGLTALEALLPALPASFPAPIVIVQHRSKDSDGGMTTVLQRHSSLPICEVEDKMPIRAGHVYLAPPDYHLLIGPTEFVLSIDAPVNAARPSVDVLFESAADSFGSRTIAVILTGLNTDGARGSRRVKDRGGTVIVQDPSTAEASSMPRGAVAGGPVDHVLSLDQVAPLLVRLCRPARGGNR